MHHTLIPLAAMLLLGGASAQVTLLKDIRPGRLSSISWAGNYWAGPKNLVSNGEIALFAANDGGTLGVTAWATNGSPAGTYHLRTGLKDPREFTLAGRRIFFSASDATNGREIWVSDGTPAGTVMPKKLMNGRLDSTQAVLAAHNGIVYFVAYGMVNNRRTLGLWRSDGSANGTFLLRPGPLGFSLRFLPTLWRSAALGKYLYFLNREAGTGDLWRTDGTVAGTTLVFTFKDRTKQIAPLITWNGRLYCDVIQNAKHELWTSDGTAAGTKLLVKGWVREKTIVPADSGDVMYFGFAPSGTGQLSELWKTNGTATGTVRVSNKVEVSNGVAIGGRKIFFAGGANGGTSPWVSDGTANGTMQLSTTIRMATTPAFDHSLARVGNGSVAVFHSLSAKGYELGISDGTPQGTRVFDYATRGGLVIWGFARTRENFALFLDDGKTGSEPHAIALTWFGAAFNEPYGRGCNGTNGVPVLRGVGGAPTLGNSKFALELSNARPNAIAVLGLSAKPANIPIGPCTLLIDLSSALLEGRLTDGAGKLRVPVAVPNIAALIGLNVYWQKIVIDPKGSLLSKFALSNGLRTLVGR